MYENIPPIFSKNDELIFAQPTPLENSHPEKNFSLLVIHFP
jgi:hypothetical protein